MEFYGSRYAPKRYKCEPVVVSTEYYDYTLDNDVDSGSNYRIMPIVYDECPPAFNNYTDDGYNIQHYGSNVVLPFSACIEIYNNKPKHSVGAAAAPGGGAYPQGSAPQIFVDATGRGMNPPGPNQPTGADYNSGEDEIIINVRSLPAHCVCCRPGSGYPQQQPVQYRVMDRASRYDYRDKPKKYYRCPMPCCSSMRSPVAAAAPPRFRRSATSRNIANDPYSIGDLSSLYRSSCYSSHRRCRHMAPPGASYAVPGSRRPQLIAEFVDIIDQCGPRRLYSKRYCYPDSSSSRMSKSRASPRDSDFYLTDFFRNSKFYSRSGSRDEQESYYKFESRERDPRGVERERHGVYMARREARADKRRSRYYDDQLGASGVGSGEVDNSMEKSGTEDSRVYFNKSYDRHHRKDADSARSSKHSIEQERDSRSTRSHRK